MTKPNHTHLSLTTLAAVLALLMVACGDSVGPGTGPVPGDPAGSPLPEMIVSNPSLTVQATVSTVVYVSLPPGTFNGADQFVIQARSSGTPVQAEPADGGFDPVAVTATAGDTLDLLVHFTTDSSVAFTKVVPEQRPPVIVRSQPPPRRRDVPLNASMLVVFSEPLDPAVLNGTSIRLLLNGMPVTGTTAFADSAHLMVAFIPANPLVAGADYALVVSRGIADLGGEVLADSVTIDFSTTGSVAPFAGTWDRLSPHSQPGDYSRFILHADGRFEIEGITNLGPYRFAGSFFGDASTSNTISLLFDDGNLAGPWTAVGVIRGDTLSVTYNIVAQLADFEDGTYLRSVPGTTPPADLVFTRGGNLYLINADGSHLRQLTNDSLGQDAEAAWSPDGTRIAFTRYRHDLNLLGEAAIYIVNADGTGLVRLSAGGPYVWDADPSWSPDGTRITFATRRDDTQCQLVQVVLCIPYQEIYVMEADGTRPVRLTSQQTLLWQPAWSPDGTRIAIVGWDAVVSDWTIMTLRPDGSGLTSIAGADSIYAPAWSPRGDRILSRTARCISWIDDPILGSTCNGTEGPYLLTMDPDGSNPLRLSDYVLPAEDALRTPFAFSPDGSQVAYTQTGCAYPLTLSYCGLPEYVEILRLSDGQVTRLAQGSSPAWRW